ncbi:MAG: HAD family hydrolase, partial [Bacteroidales bacterium]|nr:HAD family hydrolase [Bacteroidales bacterium]
MQSIRHFLNKLEKLKPIATGLKPSLNKTGDIKAVIFDIYGTLLISASGDINAASPSMHNLITALEATKIKIKSANGPDKEGKLKFILDSFFELINEQYKKSKDEEVLYPEIDILKIWTKVIGKAESKNWLQLQSDSSIRYMTVIFEVLSNCVY